VRNYIIEKHWFSTGKNATIIRLVAPCSLVVKKWAQAAKLKKAAVQFGNVPPYSLKFKKIVKSGISRSECKGLVSV